MRKLSILLAVLGGFSAGRALANSPPTQEVLVQTTPTQIPLNANTRAVKVTNRGPNQVCCAIGGNVDGGPAVYSDGGITVQLDKSECLEPYVSGTPADWMPFDFGDAPAILWCEAKTAAQVTGAATIVSQLPR